MSEADIWKQFDGEKELGAGVVDIKSFYLETAEDVAERIRAVLQHVPLTGEIPPTSSTSTPTAGSSSCPGGFRILS